MAVIGERVNVTDAAPLIVRADADGCSVTVRNLDATNSIDLGGSTVANGSGFPLPAGASHSVDLDPGEAIYGDAATGVTVSVGVFRNRA